MSSKVFASYFEKNLKLNPYYGEIMELLKFKNGVEGVSDIDTTEEDVMVELNKALETSDVGKYRISTMTCIYNFGLELNEQKLYEIAQKIILMTTDDFEKNNSNFKIVGVECFDKPIVGQQIQKKRGKLSTRKFRNQITLIIWAREANKYIKVKLFRTGRAQMTGVTSEKSGMECIQCLGNVLNNHREYLDLDERIEWNESKWSIAMMNGDLDVGYTVSREMLNTIICRRYNITSNLDADTYPGVIMKYKIGEKQITISVFSSGKVIITGANARIQIETCVRLVRFLCSKL